MSAGFGELARSHLIESDDGPDISLDWQPERGRFRIDVEEPGTEHVAPYRTILEGRLEPTLPDEPGAPVDYDLTPAPVPVRSLDAQDLRDIRINVSVARRQSRLNLVSPLQNVQTAGTVVSRQSDGACTRDVMDLGRVNLKTVQVDIAISPNGVGSTPVVPEDSKIPECSGRNC